MKDGKPEAQIIISEHPPRTVKLAAQELQTYIKKITGAELPIATQISKEWSNHIYIGESAYTEKLGIKSTGFKWGSYRTVSGKDWLVFMGGDSDYVPKEPVAHSPTDQKRMLEEWDKITGEHFNEPNQGSYRKLDANTGLWEYDLDNDGAFNGVTQFLGDLGVRWYAPGELGEVVPKLASIALPKIDKTVVPDFALRNLYFYGKNFFAGDKAHIFWQMRLGLNQGDINASNSTGHGLLWVISRDENKKAQPEFYFLKNGKRQNGVESQRLEPCLSSEELVQANVRFLRAVFDTYDYPIYSVMPTDGYMSLCECEKCEGKDTPNRGVNGILSDYVWGYVNRVATELYKTHPDKKIQCAAYGAAVLSPENIEKFSPNVVVGITYQSESPEFLQKLRADWLKKLAPGNLLYNYTYYIYNWGENRPTTCVPVIRSHWIVDDLRASKGISSGAFVEVMPSIINDINVWVFSRFLWNVNQDLDAMMEEYYKLFYGPASQQMKAFIEFSEGNWQKMPHDAKAITQAFELIEAARAVAGNDIYGERIDAIIAFMQPMKKTRERLLIGHQNARKVKALARDAKDIALDGKLDDAFWKDLPDYELIDTSSKGKPAVSTTVRMGWSGDDLYVGIRCEEPAMDKLNPGTTKNGNGAIWEADNVEIMLETQSHSYYQITINPAGAYVNVDWQDEQDMLWVSGLKYAVHQDKDSWSVEARIPITNGRPDMQKGVIGTRPGVDDPWYINIGRVRMTGGKTEGFSLSGGRFHQKLDYAEFIVEK